MPETGFASDLLIPRDGERWDLVVVGGGTAGLVTAKTAACFGADVLLVERDRTGGDCLWTGCVPSKALLAAAHAAAAARGAHRLGVHADDVVVDFDAVMRHVQRAISTIEPADSPAALRAAGVRVAHGAMTLTSRDTAEVGDAPVRFRQALLATGSAPAMPPIDGLSDAEPLTSDTVWALTGLPPRLLIMGGGSIGCELAQAFARLGSAVTVVERASRLLLNEDRDAASLVQRALTDDGVRVRLDVAVTRVRRDATAWSAELADGSGVGFDRVLVAVGREPRATGLGLEAAGVELDERGYVRVNPRLQTTNSRIWAAGDITGHPQFTHVAGVHGSLVAGNAILGLRRTVDLAIPRVTYTRPEVAAVGVGVDDARQRSLTVRTVHHTDVDRAIADGEPGGFSRLVLDGKGRVVGATIVGPRAGESLAEVVSAVRNSARARDLAATMHAYPTYGDGVWKASIEQVQRRLAEPNARRVTRLLAALRRHWVSR